MSRRRLEYVGETTAVSRNCQARTRRGALCGNPATSQIGGRALCGLHLNSRGDEGGVLQRTLPSRSRTSLGILHFSDLHRPRDHKEAIEVASRHVGADAIVLTGDFALTGEPLYGGWNGILALARLAVPGNHDRPIKEVFSKSPEWVWRCPYVVRLGGFAVLGFDTGPTTEGYLDPGTVEEAVSCMRTMCDSIPPLAVLVLSHAPMRGTAHARLARTLRGFFPSDRQIVFLHGHDHSRGGTFESVTFGAWSAYRSIVASGGDTIGHLLKVTQLTTSHEPLHR